MRQLKKSKSTAMSVHAVAGTQVVLLGLNPSEEAAKGLLGFTILKRKGKTGAFTTLKNDKRIFQGVHDKAVKAGRRPDSKTAPVQAMLWGDYSVDPGTDYTYRIIPVYGEPGALKPNKAHTVDVTIRTEHPDLGTHAIYFNSGVARSSAYSKRFKNYLRWHPDHDLSEFLTQEKRKDEKNPNAPEVLAARPYIHPGDVPPAKDGSRPAFDMLSRGLDTAMLDFIGQARGPEYSLHAVLFELTYAPAIQAFVDALESGAEVKIVHHAKHENKYLLKQDYDAESATYAKVKVGKKKVAYLDPIPKTWKANSKIVHEKVPDSFLEDALEAIGKIGLKTNDEKLLKAFDNMFIQRTKTSSLSHNKVIILLKNKKPVQVWTGSTNITVGGIFGQSNVGHVVRDEKVAKAYNDYWKMLAKDPPKLPNKKTGKAGIPRNKAIASWTVDHQKDLDPTQAPPKGITPVFSPRETDAMLNWYAERMDAAKRSVFFTAAFSVSDPLFNKIKCDKPRKSGKAYQRYLLLDGKSVGKMKDERPIDPEETDEQKKEREKALQKFGVLEKCDQNRIAFGDTLKFQKNDPLKRHYREVLTGLNHNVRYMHTKFMLLDPLGDDPVVITGSANFSDASTKDNDENMLIIRGNQRVADIYLTEFMRLFNHFRSRNERNDPKKDAAVYLSSDDSWTSKYYTEGSQEWNERELFSGKPVKPAA